MSVFDGLAGTLGAMLGGAVQPRVQGEPGAAPGGAFGAMLDAHGGLPGLLQAFERGGLGAVAQSWVSTGANQPVSADQIMAVLGSGPVADFARRLGIDPQQAAERLAELLPVVVDQLTPHGQVQPGALAALEQLFGRAAGGGGGAPQA